jgi:hypothetical protein
MAEAILMVEGGNDVHTIMHLLIRHGVNYDTLTRKGKDNEDIPEIKGFRDFGRLIASIRTTVKASYNTVGIILDADTPISSRWNAVREELASVGIDTPSDPQSSGFIIPSAGTYQRTVGVWLMPDNHGDGTLENFLYTLIPAGNQLFAYVKNATADACAHHGAVIAPKDLPKAEIAAWLAWQQEPGQPYGVAMSAKYFLHDEPLARDFVTWYKRLYRL